MAAWDLQLAERHIAELLDDLARRDACIEAHRLQLFRCEQQAMGHFASYRIFNHI